MAVDTGFEKVIDLQTYLAAVGRKLYKNQAKQIKTVTSVEVARVLGIYLPENIDCGFVDIFFEDRGVVFRRV